MTRLPAPLLTGVLAGALAGVLAGALALAPMATADAQTSPPAPSATMAPATLPAGPTPQQAAQALGVLKDDARRAEMIGVLETIARAAPAVKTPAPPAATAATGSPAAGPATAVPAIAAPATAAPPTTPVPAKLVIPLAPDSLGADVLVGVSNRLEVLSVEVGGTLRSLTNFSLVERWARGLAADAESRAELLDAAWKLLVVGGIALAIEAALQRLLRQPQAALLRLAPPAEAASPPEPPVASTGPPLEAAERRRRGRAVTTLRKFPLILGRLILDLTPVLVMGTAGYALLGSRLGEPNTTKLVILAVLNAYVACRVVTAAIRSVLSPDAPTLRLIHFEDQTAWNLLRWTRRLAVVALFGYATTEVALLFGLYRVAHDTLLKLVALVVHIMLLLVVVQNRAAIARLIRAAPGRTGLVAILRNRIAQVWHIVVIFYIVALWLVWALDVPGGFAKLVVVFISTAVVSSLARLVSTLLVAWLDHAVALDAAAAARKPGLENALRRYLPILRTLLEAAVVIAAGVLLLQIWGLDSLSWFRANALGGRLISAALTSVITIAIGLAVWEVSNAAVQNHLARLARDGHPARSARLRTLLPMLRTTLLVAISLFAGLTVLSQIGVNIAPLLAGASVIGLAIGFGSQKLVQDIITGLFLLLENTMQVGDVVTLASLTGTVENLSIRTIRLRALDGAVHIVPFSAVTTVTNLTRDFAYAMLDVSIGLNEEPDHIAEVIEQVADAMRNEPRWGAAITDRMEIMGVERFIDTAWVMRCRLRTVPSQRWAVARELNRRLKYRFDELAIESPFTSYRALSAAVPAPPNAKTLDQAAE